MEPKKRWQITKADQAAMLRAEAEADHEAATVLNRAKVMRADAVLERALIRAALALTDRHVERMRQASELEKAP